MNEQVLKDGTVIVPPKGKKFTHNINRLSSLLKRLNSNGGFCPGVKESGEHKFLKCPCKPVKEGKECPCGLFENI